MPPKVETSGRGFDAMNDAMNDACDGINTYRPTDAERILALESHVEKQSAQIETLLRIVDVYINPDLCVFHPTLADAPQIDAIKKRTIASKRGPTNVLLDERINDAVDWIEDLDCKLSHIKPKDIRPSISTQRSIDKIIAALQKREGAMQYLTYKQIGDLLGVSKGRVCQLRAAIKSDGRLTISEHPTNHKERIVTLNPQWGKMV